MVKIIQKEDPVLRAETKEIPVSAINSAKIKKIIADMKTALHSQDDGVAIAAPQIGQPLRIFIISGEVYKSASKKKLTPDDSDLVFINPVISSLSKTKKYMEEGCLSVRYLYGKVKRSDKATVKAINEKGHEFTKRGEGLLAQVFQHETDHLDGKLFIDSAIDVEDLPPPSTK
ncbi:MAG: peptide deformylase [bacterium]